MSRQTVGIWVAACLAVGLTAAEVRAQESPADEGMSANEAYEKGVEHFNEENYAKAADYFRYAVEESPHPVLRYNLAQAYARAGRPEKAIEQGVSAEQSGELDEQTSAANRGTLAAGRVALTARQFEAAPKGPKAAAIDKQSAGGEGIPFSALGWSGVGAAVGGIGMVTGSVFVANSIGDDFEAREAAREAGDRGRARELGETIRSKQTTGGILRYGGIGLAAVGAGLIVADLTLEGPGAGSGRAEFRVEPRVGVGRIGIGVTY